VLREKGRELFTMRQNDVDQNKKNRKDQKTQKFYKHEKTMPIFMQKLINKKGKQDLLR
jgi:hypothetical protein